MADSESEHTLKFGIDESPEAQQWRDILSGDKTFTLNVKVPSEYAAPPPDAQQPSGASSPFAPVGRSAPAKSPQQTVYEKLDALYKQTFIKQAPEQLKFFKNINTLTASLTSPGGGGGLTALLRGIGSVGGPIGGPAGAAASIAAFTINRAQSFREAQAQAQAYGLTPAQQAAFTNITKQYTGGEAGTSRLFGGILGKQTELGGTQMMSAFLGQYGIKTTGKETQDELAENFLRAQQKIATTVPQNMWKTTADMFGMGDIVDIGTMERFKN